MSDFRVWTHDVDAVYDGPRATLGSILLPAHHVPERFFLDSEQVTAWSRLKSAKSESRIHRDTGTVYRYTEGTVAFPDRLDGPSRTILTGETGVAPSRFKHVVRQGDRYRRLAPVELERLNGFPDHWTAGMSDGRRAFCMGNALMVGVVERIAAELIREFDYVDSGLSASVFVAARQTA